LDVVRVIVAGELPREPHNAPLHLFSASPELVGFASKAYQRRSGDTSGLLGQLFEGLRREGLTMSFTMEDFRRQYVKEHFPQLTPAEQREVLESLPSAELLAALSQEQIRQLKDLLTAANPAEPRKPRRKG
jgi:hypothetical protein